MSQGLEEKGEGRRECAQAPRQSCSSPTLHGALFIQGYQFTHHGDDVSGRPSGMLKVVPSGKPFLAPLSPHPAVGDHSTASLFCTGGTEAGRSASTHSKLGLFSIMQGLYVYL